MSRKQRIFKPIVIAVEGENFFHFLLNKIDGLPGFENVQLWNFKENGLEFRTWLSDFRKTRGFETMQSLGIMHDAEESASRTEQSIQDSLREYGFAIPPNSNKIVEGSPRVSYLIIPNDTQAGCLEHSILQAVESDQRLKCAENFFNCIEADNQRLGTQIKTEEYAIDNWKAKVKVHALIAGSEVPESSLGNSVKINMWDWEQPSLKVMLDFIRNLT